MKNCSKLLLLIFIFAESNKAVSESGAAKPTARICYDDSKFWPAMAEDSPPIVGLQEDNLFFCLGAEAAGENIVKMKVVLWRYSATRAPEMVAIKPLRMFSFGNAEGSWYVTEGTAIYRVGSLSSGFCHQSDNCQIKFSGSAENEFDVRISLGGKDFSLIDSGTSFIPVGIRRNYMQAPDGFMQQYFCPDARRCHFVRFFSKIGPGEKLDLLTYSGYGLNIEPELWKRVEQMLSEVVTAKCFPIKSSPESEANHYLERTTFFADLVDLPDDIPGLTYYRYGDPDTVPDYFFGGDRGAPVAEAYYFALNKKMLETRYVFPTNLSYWSGIVGRLIVQNTGFLALTKEKKERLFQIQKCVSGSVKEDFK